MGGGVIIAIKNGSPSSLVRTDSSLELIWVKVGIKFRTYIIGVCYYRLPNASTDFADCLHEALDEIKIAFPHCPLILSGDFNYPAIDWKMKTVQADGASTRECKKLLDVTKRFQLHQIVLQPTRAEAVLDLIFISHPEYSSVNVLDAISDHRVVHCTLEVSVDTRDVSKKIIYILKQTWKL